MIRSSRVKEGRIDVVNSYPSDSKTGETLDSVFPSVRMAQLFYEFLDRYKIWRLAKLQAAFGMIIIFFLGLGVLLIPWFLPKIGILSLGILILFYFAVHYYLEVKHRVSHLYINVHILHHHLTGKLEVGFCDHYKPCHCVKDFRDYVLKNYRISFDNGYLR